MLMAPLGVPAGRRQANAERVTPGLIVASVAQNSAGGQQTESAGLRAGDMLLSLDGKPLRFVSQIVPIRDGAAWDGKKTIAAVVRRGGQTLTLNLTTAIPQDFETRPPLPPGAAKL